MPPSPKPLQGAESTVRLEQLVLFGPSDNFSVQFGPRVTVLAGLADAERATMLRTLVDAMAGRVPNASVIFVDQAGRRVYADRMGATYADSGIAAPSLSELLGSDPDVIADLVTLRGEDLGLGEHRTEAQIAADLVAARAAVEQVTAEHADAKAFVVEVDAWRDELARLDQRIDAAPDAEARWAWIQLRDQLDELRAELASIEIEDDDDVDADTRLLAAVEELRSAGETWAEASAAATELGRQLGPLPPVSDADLARVAATPEVLPEDFAQRIAAIDATAEIRRACEDGLVAALAPAEDPADGIVYRLAHLDQDRLWAVHDEAVKAQRAYEAELAARIDDAEPEVETEVEDAHHAVIRCQREVERRTRPGLLGTSGLAATALLATQSVGIFVGILFLVAAAAMGVWLLVIPRRELATAELEEELALGDTDADSWLGLHLRRIDDVMQPAADRSALNAAVELRSKTLLDWEELTERTTLSAATERRDAIVAYAAAIDPAARTARERTAIDALDAAREQEREARVALTSDLAAYGLSPESAADLTPEQMRNVLEQRTAAGRFARRAVELQHQTALATTSGALLDRLLKELGFDDGDLAGRLERAIVSVEAARRRRLAAEDTRAREELEAEVARLHEAVVTGHRPSWDATPDPTEAPATAAQLMDQRRALTEQVESQRLPDLADVQRRLGVATERVRMLEAELGTLSDGPTAVRRRLADRIARTTWVGPNEEALPLVIDDALVDVDPEELFKLLDMVVRLSSRTQIVLLTSDATIAKWARREAAHGVITLFESDGAAIR